MTNTPPTLAIPDRALVAGRWIAAFVGIVSSLPAAERADRSLAFASAWVVGVATWRTVRPFERLPQMQRRIWLVFEVGSTAAAVAFSGAWISPFTSSLVVVTVLAALSEDLVGAWLAIIGLLVIVFTIGAVSHDSALLGGDFARLFTTIVVGAVAGVAVRRGFSRLRNQAMTQTGELQRLSDTNALMVRLTKLTRAGETIREPRDIAVAAASRLAVSFQADLTTIMQRGEPGQDWTTLTQHHGSQAVSLAEPSPASYASSDIAAITGPLLIDGDTATEPIVGRLGLSKRQRPTVIAPLAVRNETFGVVVVERDGTPFTADERGQLGAMCEVLSLSIDNSRWFRRLRSMGAEDERSRIARELHDRLGSSVAYSAFAFERLRQHYKDDRDLAKAHDEARTTVGELRDLLWQLRTGVTQASPLSVVGVDLARRFSNRTGIYTTFSAADEARLPLTVEVELLRVTQEALNNVEKHAHATEVFITYEPSVPTTRLTITDNGVGFDPDAIPSAESYGLSGIRERADAIGASVRITSSQVEPTGTTVLLSLATDETFVTQIGGEAPKGTFLTDALLKNALPTAGRSEAGRSEAGRPEAARSEAGRSEADSGHTLFDFSNQLDISNKLDISDRPETANQPETSNPSGTSNPRGISRQSAVSNPLLNGKSQAENDRLNLPSAGETTQSGRLKRELPIERNGRSINHEDPATWDLP